MIELLFSSLKFVAVRFEDLQVRQQGRELYSELYQIIHDRKDIGLFFKDQLLRAVLSISNNIAEGFERETNQELKRFLYIAKGSCGEVRSMLYIALDQKIITLEQFNIFHEKVKHLSIMLYKYIEKIKATN